MNFINECELVDFIRRSRDNGKTSDDIRTLVLNKVEIHLAELLPLPNRILDAWGDALKMQKTKNNP